LSSFDLLGGAARSAYRLHASLSGLGIDSGLFVGEKESNDSSVIPFAPPFDARTRLRRGLRRRFLEMSQRPISSRPAGASFFTDDRSQHRGDVFQQIPAGDILHLHWIAGLIDYTEFFEHVPRALPLVWTLHDMNPFTGGCHYSAECRKFSEECGCCPQLGSAKCNDLSRAIWKRKHGAYSHIDAKRFCVVTPSRWLADEAKRSALMGGFRVEVIPYGVDTNCFQPQDRAMARERLGIPGSATVLLFVAQLLRNSYKGVSVLMEALQRAGTIANLLVLAVGGGALPAGFPAPCVSLGAMNEERELSLAYSASDLFVLPSLQDNFPNTALEALACGVPVVGTRVGGIPEIVRDGCTGLVVEQGNAAALAAAIGELLTNAERRAEMAGNCRRVALEEYTLEMQARRYVGVYESLLS